jgi:hypothetical protein
MATWRDIAADSDRASRTLFGDGRWRSSASRAYYALYSLVTGWLHEQGATLHASRGNPAHEDLPKLILRNLSGFSEGQRQRLATAARRLYAQRIAADYVPGFTVDETEARLSVAELTVASRIADARRAAR